MKNLKEFKKLIKTYQQIIENPPKKYKRGDMYFITGFGDKTTCKLCNSIFDVFCSDCIYLLKSGNKCDQGANEISYWKIRDAKDSKELVSALEMRVTRMKEILKM